MSSVDKQTHALCCIHLLPGTCKEGVSIKQTIKMSFCLNGNEILFYEIIIFASLITSILTGDTGSLKKPATVTPVLENRYSNLFHLWNELGFSSAWKRAFIFSHVFLALMLNGPIVVSRSAWMTLPKIPFQGSTAEAALKVV